MKPSLPAIAQITGFSALYAMLVILYCFLYAPIGLENNDGGFILGLAHQFSKGAQIYGEIVYIRPPASIILHSLSFIAPFDVAPILTSRIFYFVQIGAYSALTSLLVCHHFKFGPASSFFLASLCFMFNAHNFPPMAWHTVDGLFFSVLALSLATLTQDGSTSTIIRKSFLAFVFAFLAALSKQPFYIAPLLVGFVLIYPLSVRRIVMTAVAGLSSAIAVYACLAWFLNLDAMLVAITSQTNLRDLISAGVVNYARDWYNLRSIASVGPLALVLLIWVFGRLVRKEVSPRPLHLALALSVTIFLASMLQMFLVTDRWVSPSSMIDSLFTVTAMVSLLESFRTRQRIWVVLTALHGIAWAASISWGYTTVALFSAPSVIVVALVCVDLGKGLKKKTAISAVGVCSAIAIFFAGHQFLYSLEGPLKRSNAVVNIGTEFPVLAGIRVTVAQAEALRELRSLKSRLGENLVVMPNWPLYNTIFGGLNPLGMDWLLNTEVGPFDQAIRSRLDTVDYVLVFRNASPSPESGNRFGSEITQTVTQNWILEDDGGKYFKVYSNPIH
jgi:hypothetical protein